MRVITMARSPVGFVRWGSSLRLVAAAQCVPHPEKGDDGEDAFFVTPGAVGVADGVGGWAAHGVDSGTYARELMLAASEYSAPLQEAGEDVQPLDILQASYAHVSRRRDLGSATACIVSIVGSGEAVRVETANLGDSGLMHLRKSVAGWEVVARSEEQQHTFNCPIQLGSESADVPSDAQLMSHAVYDGDFLICGTDGIFDNLFDDELVELVTEASEAHAQAGGGNGGLFDVDALCTMIIRVATVIANDMEVVTPFSENAAGYGYDALGGKVCFYLPLHFKRILLTILTCPPHILTFKNALGGKLDDMTVVCAHVCADSR